MFLAALAFSLALGEPASSTAAPVASSRVTRVAVYDLDMSGVPRHWGPLLGNALTHELRKLQQTSVVSTDEIRAMLEHEANRQLLACEGGSSCLAEVADALGVDVLVTGSVARVGDEHLFSLKRIDPSGKQSAQQVTRRIAAGNGEELLVAIGPGVAELFPEASLRPGTTRGVDKELARRLNPPPLPPWVALAGASTAAVLLVAGGALGIANAALAADAADYRDHAAPFVERTFEEKAGAVDVTAIAAWSSIGGAIVVGAATGVAALWTDFDLELEGDAR